MRKAQIQALVEDAHKRITAVNVLLHDYRAAQNTKMKELIEEFAKLIKRLEGQGLLLPDIMRVNFKRDA